MKNLLNILLGIFIVVLNNSCQKKNLTVEGVVRDIGTQQPLEGIDVYVMRNNGKHEVEAGVTVRTDANGYFKVVYDHESGYPNYELRCDDLHLPPTKIWKWVDVNKLPNPYNVANSGEKLSSDKRQHVDLWMGRLASFDSLIFETDTPFVKGDLFNIDIYDQLGFHNEFDAIKPGIGSWTTKDTLYNFYFAGTGNQGLANSDKLVVELYGTRSGVNYNFKDTILLTVGSKRRIYKKLK
ncbi:MAG: hypothetical protein HYZ42_07055 [Bacteroidetes bacterium]|nr:hypothetical protein [Bacteroidota bacterium]